jgi:hypothetical protein
METNRGIDMRRVGLASAIMAIICIAFACSLLPPCMAQGDTTKPVTNASVQGTLGSNGWLISNASVNLSATDDESGVNRTLYSLDGAPYVSYTSNITLSDGNHTLFYFSIDNAGNSETLKMLNVRVDTGSPTMNITIKGNQSVNGWYNGSVVVSLTASDNCSGIWSASYSLDSGAWTPYAGNITLGDGQHVLAYGCYDWAGNAYNNTVSLNVSDPEVIVNLSGTRLSNGWFTSDVMVSFVATGGAGGVDHVEYSLNGAGWASGNYFNVTGEGWNRVDYRAVDGLGIASETRTCWVPIDKTGPTISISVDGDKSSKGWYNGDVKVTLHASDNAGINATEYSWDGTHWNAYKDPLKVDWGFSRTIWYRAIDMAGNVAQGSYFIYFRPMSIDMGPMSDAVYINGVYYGPSPTPMPSPSPSPSPSPQAPSPTPSAMPSATPAYTAGANGSLAVAVLVGVLALMAIAGIAVYLFMLKPK